MRNIAILSLAVSLMATASCSKKETPTPVSKTDTLTITDTVYLEGEKSPCGCLTEAGTLDPANYRGEVAYYITDTGDLVLDNYNDLPLGKNMYVANTSAFRSLPATSQWRKAAGFISAGIAPNRVELVMPVPCQYWKILPASTDKYTNYIYWDAKAMQYVPFIVYN